MNKFDQRQVEIYRGMSAVDKIRLAEKVYWDARSLRETALKLFCPNLSKAEIKDRVRREFLLGRTD